MSIINFKLRLLQAMYASAVTAWLSLLFVPAVAQRIPLPPSGTLIISCRLDNAPYGDGKIYLDGQEAGRCPEVTVRLGTGRHSVRAGLALGNNRYLAYENGHVEVLKDSTQQITATLAPTTAEKSASLVYAMGARDYSIRPPEDTKTGLFNPDATILAVGAETNSVRLYNAADGQALCRLGDAGKYWVSFVTALCFSADGHRLASDGWLYDSYIGELNIWDVESRKLLRKIPGVPKVSALALSPDGKLLAAGVKPNTIKLWSVSDGRLLWTINAPGTGEEKVAPLIFTPEGRLLIAGHQAGHRLYVYDVLTSRAQATLEGSTVVLDAEGRAVTCQSKDADAVRSTWRLPKGELIDSRELKNSSLTRCMNEQILIAASGNWAVLDLRNEPLMRALDNPNRIALMRNGRRVLFYADNLRSIRSLPTVPEDPHN